MHEIQSLCLPEFSDAVFARQGISVTSPVSYLFEHALRGMFTFVNTDPPARLVGTFADTRPLGADGKPTNLANALRVLFAHDLDGIDYCRYVLQHEHTGQGSLFPEHHDSEGMQQAGLHELLAHNDAVFVKTEALPKMFRKAVQQVLFDQFERMPRGPSSYFDLQRMNLSRDYMNWCVGGGEHSWWHRYAPKERAWLVERFAHTLHEGPLANVISPCNPHWEQVLAQVKTVLDALLYYFVGLMVDGFHDHWSARYLAEILHNFHKHPILGIRKTKPEAWCMLVS
jgi:hypothetical protein